MHDAFGKSKVAPKNRHTIPRIEFCAAVLANLVGEILSQELDIPVGDIQYYSDSKVVLGYLSDERRMFYVYVCNRLDRICKSSTPLQWHHVSTDENPVDEATRGILPEQLCTSLWLNDPAFLRESTVHERTQKFPLVHPEEDSEIGPDVTALKTVASTPSLAISRFKRFENWMSLVRAIVFIRKRIRREFGCMDNVPRRDTEHFIF